MDRIYWFLIIVWLVMPFLTMVEAELFLRYAEFREMTVVKIGRDYVSIFMGFLRKNIFELLLFTFGLGVGIVYMRKKRKQEEKYTLQDID